MDKVGERWDKRMSGVNVVLVRMKRDDSKWVMGRATPYKARGRQKMTRVPHEQTSRE